MSLVKVGFRGSLGSGFDDKSSGDAAIIGEVSEWLKEHAWKVCILERVSRVRIPLSPLSTAEALAKAVFRFIKLF